MGHRGGERFFQRFERIRVVALLFAVPLSVLLILLSEVTVRSATFQPLLFVLLLVVHLYERRQCGGDILLRHVSAVGYVLGRVLGRRPCRRLFVRLFAVRFRRLFVRRLPIYRRILLPFGRATGRIFGRRRRGRLEREFLFGVVLRSRGARNGRGSVGGRDNSRWYVGGCGGSGCDGGGRSWGGIVYLRETGRVERRRRLDGLLLVTETEK